VYRECAFSRRSREKRGKFIWPKNQDPQYHSCESSPANFRGIRFF
jgi:hypothetical protein